MTRRNLFSLLAAALWPGKRSAPDARLIGEEAAKSWADQVDREVLRSFCQAAVKDPRQARHEQIEREIMRQGIEALAFESITGDTIPGPPDFIYFSRGGFAARGHPATVR